MSSSLYQRHRFPHEVISHCVWLYHRFCLSFRDVEELMIERGVVLSYETVRRGCLKFGGEYARRLKRRRAQPGDKWQVDEVFLSINGERRYLWRAVDQEGNTLDILMTRERDKRAAKRFFHKLLRAHAKPRAVVTDKLRSYGAALKELLLRTEHRQSRYLNNRAECSHQRTRRREWALRYGQAAGRCSASTLPAMQGASCLSSNPSTDISAHPGTSLKPTITARRCRSGSRSGVK